MPRSAAAGRPGGQVLPESVMVTVAGVDERAMPDDCTVRRRGAGPAREFSPVEDRYVDPDRAVVYTGACRVEPFTRTGRGRREAVSDTQVEIGRYLFSVPLDGDGADDLAINDLAEMNASIDGRLIGATLRLAERIESTSTTARRFVAELTD